MNSASSVFELAVDGPVVKRAILMAVVVGTILVMINHGSCITRGHFGGTCLIQSALTFLVPYAVSTISSVQAIQCRAKRESESPGN